MIVAEDDLPLPKGLRVRARHAGLKTEVASEVTSVGDATVRCVLAKNEAFFVGEEYVLTVDGAMGVGGGEATFVVSDAAAATGAIEVRITLTRASADVSVKLAPTRPSRTTGAASCSTSRSRRG